MDTKQILFTFEEAGRLLGGISPWTLRKHAQRKNVRVTHLGQRAFIDARELGRIRRQGLPRLTQEGNVKAGAAKNTAAVAP